MNGELTWQAAQVAGYSLPAAQVTQTLEALLTGRGKSQADLTRALAANGLTPQAFRAYFDRLVTVDQFTRREAQARGITIGAYISQLQGAARISFGPAAQVALIRPTATRTPAPAATSVPVATPAPAPVAAVARGTEIGQHAPQFRLPTLNTPQSDFVTLGDLAGKPLVLSFWTTWCPYCRNQTPVLVDAYQRYRARGVQFLGVNVKEVQPIVQEYVSANGIPYPVGLDLDGQAGVSFNVNGFPTTYFLDRDGVIVVRHVGQLTTETLEAYLAVLMSDTR